MDISSLLGQWSSGVLIVSINAPNQLTILDSSQPNQMKLKTINTYDLLTKIGTLSDGSSISLMNEELRFIGGDLNGMTFRKMQAPPQVAPVVKPEEKTPWLWILVGIGAGLFFLGAILYVWWGYRKSNDLARKIVSQQEKLDLQSCNEMFENLSPHLRHFAKGTISDHCRAVAEALANNQDPLNLPIYRSMHRSRSQ